MSTEQELCELKRKLDAVSVEADTISGQLYMLMTDPVTEEELGKEAVRFLEGMKIHIDNCFIAIEDMDESIVEKINAKRKWE